MLTHELHAVLLVQVAEDLQVEAVEERSVALLRRCRAGRSCCRRSRSGSEARCSGPRRRAPGARAAGCRASATATKSVSWAAQDDIAARTAFPRRRQAAPLRVTRSPGRAWPETRIVRPSVGLLPVPVVQYCSVKRIEDLQGRRRFGGDGRACSPAAPTQGDAGRRRP